MTVRSRYTSEDRTRPRIGFLRPGHVERAFIVLLYVTLAVLVALSVLGTFYGRRAESAPITAPLRVLSDVTEEIGAFTIAIAIQGTLTVIQYGARQMARRDRRWWLLYLVALGVSVYYNIEAYWTPLTALIPSYAAAVAIVAGDVAPEYIAVRRE